MADVQARKQEVIDARVEAENAAERAKDAVYNEEPTRAEFAFGEGMRAVQRWKRARRRHDQALSSVAEVVPYA